MPSNDEVVFGIPNIQCPSCQQVLDCSGKRIDKFTKDQRRKMNDAPNTWNAESSKPYTSGGRDPFPTGEDATSEAAEKNYILVTCNNHRCDQYNKFKVLQLPRIKTASAKVDLNG